MVFSLLAPLAAGFFLEPAPPSALADLFVDGNNANCAAGTGAASNPVCSIGAAIALAAPGDTIFIAPGTYVETVDLQFDLDLIGTGGASVTTLDGGGTDPIMGARVVTIPSGVTVTIDGMTIRNGIGGATNVSGGGIDLAGSLTLTNSTISGI